MNRHRKNYVVSFVLNDAEGNVEPADLDHVVTKFIQTFLKNGVQVDLLSKVELDTESIELRMVLSKEQLQRRIEWAYLDGDWQEWGKDNMDTVIQRGYRGTEEMSIEELEAEWSGILGGNWDMEYMFRQSDYFDETIEEQPELNRPQLLARIAFLMTTFDYPPFQDNVKARTFLEMHFNGLPKIKEWNDIQLWNLYKQYVEDDVWKEHLDNNYVNWSKIDEDWKEWTS